MLTRFASMAAGWLMVSTLPCAAIDFFPLPMAPQGALIYSVESASIEILKTEPPAIVVAAVGRTNSGGWSNARLEPRYYINPPADGIWDIDFVAMPPPADAIVTMGLVKHTAHLVLPDIPPSIAGFRIHTASNSLEVMLPGARVMAFAAAGEGTGIDSRALTLDLNVFRPIFIDKMPGPGGSKTTYLRANFTLTNTGTEPADLFAPTPCDIVNWDIRTPDGQPVQEEPPVICIRMIATLTLEPGQAVGDRIAIPLDPNAFVESGDYVFGLTYWGARAESPINVQVVH